MRNAFKPARSYPLRQGVVAFKRRVSEPATSPSKRSNAPRKFSFSVAQIMAIHGHFGAVRAWHWSLGWDLRHFSLSTASLSFPERTKSKKPGKPTGRPKGVISTRKANSYAFASPVARVIRQLIPQNGMSAA